MTQFQAKWTSSPCAQYSTTTKVVEMPHWFMSATVLVQVFYSAPVAKKPVVDVNPSTSHPDSIQLIQTPSMQSGIRVCSSRGN
jgi:hypothetical protein